MQMPPLNLPWSPWFRPLYAWLMTEYRALTDVPPLVREAMTLAERLEFALSCTEATGRLLRLLASQVRGGRIGETGTGCGVGAAWLASGLAPDTMLFTIERVEERASAARELFRPYPNVQVLHGDARELLAHGPFDLLFLDGGPNIKGHMDGSTGPDEADVAAVLDALHPGGLIVLDDLTPERDWPPEWRGRPDRTRQFWLNDPRVAATELLVDPRGGIASAVILATKVR
jgi:predicted O-methyltransferase YrrM